MSRESYEKCLEYTRRYIGGERVRFLVKLLTVFTAVSYIILIAWLVVCRDKGLLSAVFFPAGGFVAVTLLRKGIGAKRPYEVYGFTPLLHKNSRRNSFPSRHVFSNVIIAMVVLRIWMPMGILLLVSSGLLAVLRVITGVHFPRDVIGGALLAVLLGFVVF
jgi:membrane-associated phospholipid phosphatase